MSYPRINNDQPVALWHNPAPNQQPNRRLRKKPTWQMMGAKITSLDAALSFLRREPSGIYMQVVQNGRYLPQVLCYFEVELHSALQGIGRGKNTHLIMRPVQGGFPPQLVIKNPQMVSFRRR